MRPVNEKSLLHHLFDQMDKLANREITTEEAQAQAKLAGEANKLFKQEMDRARLIMDLQNHAEATGNIVTLREIASKGFEDTTNTIENSAVYEEEN